MLNREFKVLLSNLGKENEISVPAKKVLSWLEEAFDAVDAIASQSTLTGEENALHGA